MQDNDNLENFKKVFGFDTVKASNQAQTTKPKVRESLHETMKQPGIIHDRIVGYRGDVADKIFDALILPQVQAYALNGIEEQRFIVFCDVAGYYAFIEKNNRPNWQTITQGIDESPSPTGGGSSQRIKDGGYYPNFVATPRPFEREIKEISMARISALSRNHIPAELHNQNAELQKIRADSGILLTETLPLAFVGIGQVYVKSLLMRLGEVQKLFHDANQETAIRSHLTCIHSSLAAINKIADKEDCR